MKSRRSASHLVLLTLVACGLGCATDAMRPKTQTWSEVGSSDYTPSAPKDDSQKLMTAREYAARFHTSAECELEARRVAAENEKGGVALFRACLSREDFRELEPFFTPPWRPLLADTAGMLELGRILAVRGGFVAQDLATLQQEDVPVFSLGQATEQPDATRGRVVIARLRFIKERKEAPGQLIFEEATLSPDDELLEDDEEEPVATSRYPTVLTGQRVLLELPEQREPMRAGDELIVVSEFLGIERVMNPEAAEEQEWAVLRVLGRFEPSTRLGG